MKIAIVGMGYVGKAMDRFFSRCYETVPYDQPLGVGLRRDVNECDCAVVCVPTPQAPDGSCDTSIVEEVVGWIETPLVIIKSTVSPGTTDLLACTFHKPLIFSPEY